MPDRTPPVVHLTAPSDSARVSGSVRIAADITDRGIIDFTSFYVDRRLIAVDSLLPAEAYWQTDTVPLNTWHAIYATCYDRAGNLGYSDTVSVLVEAAPPPPLQLTTSLADDQRPVWSPAGTQILFTSKRGGDWGIYVVNADGTGEHVVRDSVGADEVQPDWQGNLIVFSRSGNIWSIHPDGTAETRLTTGVDDLDQTPRITPDGQYIVWRSVRDNHNGWFHPYRMKVDGSEQATVNTWAYCANLNWIGSELLYSWSTYWNDPRDLHRTDLFGANDRALTTGQPLSFPDQFSASPDDSTIAYLLPGRDIWLMNGDGSNQRALVTGAGDDCFGTTNENPSQVWTPDGQTLVFTSERNGNPDVFRINADGTGLAAVVTGDSVDCDGVLSPDATKLAFVSRRTGNEDIWVMPFPQAR
jgi:Tol biopolymer transport system component